MKKFAMVFAFSATFLTACGSNELAKSKAQDSNELAPGVMQPVAGSGASEGSFGWASDIQSAPMPSTMK